MRGAIIGNEFITQKSHSQAFAKTQKEGIGVEMGVADVVLNGTSGARKMIYPIQADPGAIGLEADEREVATLIQQSGPRSELCCGRIEEGDGETQVDHPVAESEF